MKKISILLFSAALLFAFSGKKMSVKVTDVDVKKTANSYSLNVTVVYRGVNKFLFEGIPVYISTERLGLSGYVKKAEIREQDFIFAQKNVDLNNDGDFNDVYKVKKYKGAYYVNNSRIKILMPQRKINNFLVYQYKGIGGAIINRVTKNGVPFIVYGVEERTGKVFVGLEPGGVPKIETFSNPNVQILVAREVRSLKSKAGYTISGGKNYITYTNEKIYAGQDEQWAVMKWVVVPLALNSTGRSSVAATLSNIKPPFVVFASVNLSVADGIRMRTASKMEIVK